MTTREPGASEVLTLGLTLRPNSTAFLATRPAAISTLGLEVLVQEVMAAIRISPFCRVRSLPSISYSSVKVSEFLLKPSSDEDLENSSSKVDLTSVSLIKSCGRFGPATEGTIELKSSFNSLV